MSINQLDAITVDVVEAARETLVIGTYPAPSGSGGARP
jgi:hypothetical protein